MIYIGNQTSCWTGTATEPFAYAVANGFDAFEWFPDKKPNGGWDETDLDAAQRRQIRNVARAHAMRLSVHARWQANPLQPESRPLIVRDLELAQELGAVLLNIHFQSEAGLPAFVEAITPLLGLTAQAGVQLSIENTPVHSPEDFNDLFTHLRGLKSLPVNHVGMCLDLGHANLCAATRNDYLAFLARLAPAVPIVHLHLHENWGDADTHLPLFTGPAARDDSGIRRLLEQLQQRRFSGSIILEQWPHPPTLLNQARNRLLELLQVIGQESKGRGLERAPKSEGIRPGAGNRSARRANAVESASLVATDGHPEHPSGFSDALVAGDRGSRSWREKLDAVRQLLASENASSLTAEQLVDVAIYLRFLGTGQIACAEDGRHFRPAHHARIALQIQDRLARPASPDEAYLARRIYPWLPSAAQEFQRAEPLTRIRDIAHRNDIPSELKREIKDTLQNKLHRCAGPEDLATSANLLKRITAPGANCSADFVAQFRIFHRELEEFFNAQSLGERLKALLPRANAEQASRIRCLLDRKVAAGLSENADTLAALTQLRRSFLEVTKELAGADAQEFLLADIALEDFAFVLLSTLINQVEAAPAPPPWQSLLDLMGLILANLESSSVAPAECRAVQAELRAWQQNFDAEDREQLLRVKASLERSRRVAEDFSGRILAWFAGRAERLGRALGIAPEAIRVFSEGEIRSHLMFQLAKLVSIALRRIRRELSLTAWEIIVVGQATGRVTVMEQLRNSAQDQAEPVIALLGRAQGDEDIPRGISAIVLGHDIPHLSHLSVRARQARVVLVAAEDRTEFERLQALEGQRIALVATPEQLKWKHVDAADLASSPTILEVSAECATAEQVGRRGPHRAATPDKHSPRRGEDTAALPLRSVVYPAGALGEVPEARLATGRPCIPIEEVSLPTGGGKADGIRRLTELARRPGAGFAVPPALVIPFGVMEAALQSTPNPGAEHATLLSRADDLSVVELEREAKIARDRIQRLDVPNEVLAAITGRFHDNRGLMVRSSANCEDLEDLAGAGLYASVVNVAPQDLLDAVRTVWSSLWTARAAVSRMQAGIPHAQAHMAVLIQEMIIPNYSFVLHTVNPLNQNPRELFAEVAVGMGETLASAATPGTPYRFVCNKDNGSVTVLAFANFSRGCWPAPHGGADLRIIDYSQVQLSVESNARLALGRRLAALGRLVESAFEGPQDIEGAVSGDQIYLLQSRPQQGLG